VGIITQKGYKCRGKGRRNVRATDRMIGKKKKEKEEGQFRI